MLPNYPSVRFRPKALDLFAGAGGMSLGLTAAGFDVLGVELNPLACETHRREVGPCLCMNVMHFSPSVSDGYALCAFGSPCQSYSQAGRRGAMSVPQGLLYQEGIRVASEGRIPHLLMENVSDVLTTAAQPGSSRKVLDVILDDMEAAGYQAVYQMLDASHFGLPQRRRRVFIFASRDAAVLHRFHFPRATHGPGLLPFVTARQATGIAYDRPAPTVVASEAKSVRTPMKDRAATTLPRRSLERMAEEVGTQMPWPTTQQYQVLQGFPAEMVFSGNKEQRLTMIGNAVPPVMGALLGRAVLLAMGG